MERMVSEVLRDGKRVVRRDGLESEAYDGSRM